MKMLRMQLAFYQRLMVIAKTTGDMKAHEVYRQMTRHLVEEIRRAEMKEAAQERTA